MKQDIKNLQAELDNLKEELILSVSAEHVKTGKSSTKTLFGTSLTERCAILLAEGSCVQGLEGLRRDRARLYENLKEARRRLDKEELAYIWLRYGKEKSYGGKEDNMKTTVIMILVLILAAPAPASSYTFQVQHIFEATLNEECPLVSNLKTPAQGSYRMELKGAGDALINYNLSVFEELLEAPNWWNLF